MIGLVDCNIGVESSFINSPLTQCQKLSKLKWIVIKTTPRQNCVSKKVRLRFYNRSLFCIMVNWFITILQF